MNEELIECAEYFRKRSEFKRIMEAMLKNYKSYGYSAGFVSIRNASSEECMAASEIVAPKRPYRPPVLRFRLSDFESGLAFTKYKNISLKMLLEEYFQIRIISNSELANAENEIREEFWKGIMSEHSGSPCLIWLSEMKKNQNYGYRSVMLEYKASSENARNIIDNIVKAAEKCINSENYIQLAVLSAEVTGNPHYFDKSETAGRLLLQCLSFLSGSELSGASEKEKEIYDSFRIEPDGISGASAVSGIRFYFSDKTEHPGYKYFADNREMCLVPVSGLKDIAYADCDRKRVFVVENPMVFSALLSVAASSGECLMCTFGQVKYSGLKIIDMLSDNGCTVYYSGDFDPEGLQIADRLISRNKKIHPWHMEKDDYIRAEKSEEISGRRLRIFDSVSDPVLKETAEEIKKTGKSAYQELLIDMLAGDIIKGYL